MPNLRVFTPRSTGIGVGGGVLVAGAFGQLVDVRPPARELAARLRCQGRRYDELRSALERLLAEGVVDCAQRPDARSDRDRGYALTERGRHRAETLREASDSGASTNREEAEACSEGATVSKVASPAVPRNGNATPPAREEEAEASSEGASVSKVAVPSGGRKRKRRRNTARQRGRGGGVFGGRERFQGCGPSGGRKRKRRRNTARQRGRGGGVFGGRERFRGCGPSGGRKRKRNNARGGTRTVRGRRSRARRRRGGWGWAGGARESTELCATARGSPAALVSAAWRERNPTHVQNGAHAFSMQRALGRGSESSVQTAGR